MNEGLEHNELFIVNGENPIDRLFEQGVENFVSSGRQEISEIAIKAPSSKAYWSASNIIQTHGANSFPYLTESVERATDINEALTTLSGLGWFLDSHYDYEKLESFNWSTLSNEEIFARIQEGERSMAVCGEIHTIISQVATNAGLTSGTLSVPIKGQTHVVAYIEDGGKVYIINYSETYSGDNLEEALYQYQQNHGGLSFGSIVGNENGQVEGIIRTAFQKEFTDETGIDMRNFFKNLSFGNNSNTGVAYSNNQSGFIGTETVSFGAQNNSHTLQFGAQIGEHEDFRGISGSSIGLGLHYSDTLINTSQGDIRAGVYGELAAAFKRGEGLLGFSDGYGKVGGYIEGNHNFIGNTKLYGDISLGVYIFPELRDKTEIDTVPYIQSNLGIAGHIGNTKTYGKIGYLYDGGEEIKSLGLGMSGNFGSLFADYSQTTHTMSDGVKEKIRIGYEYNLNNGDNTTQFSAGFENDGDNASAFAGFKASF